MAEWQPARTGDLAPYACAAPRANSRRYRHSDDDRRTSFQRDCDRIVHSTAFRLLMHKTQVFVAPVCGEFRTRLTHTIEVARVARSLASALRLNPDLAESVALAHDLGHTPFGHIGEQTLAGLMKDHGGFEHNAQAIRIVTGLERSYIGFDGLNLTWETLEGIAKHNGPVLDSPQTPLADYNLRHDLDLGTFPSAEAQVAAVADDIAYNCHDLQDGLRAGLFSCEDLSVIPVVGDAFVRVRAENPDAGGLRIAQTALRRVFGELTEDVYAASSRRLREFAPESVEDVRLAGRRMVRFSDSRFKEMAEIRSFLFDRMYRNERINNECRDGSAAIKALFRHYMDHPSDLPSERREDYEAARDISGKSRAVADCIAGLTDRFALDEHERIAGPTPAGPAH